MKRINVKNIMEKGGLMIEALAMLGLIAVVTPTMYKKSAERTMEIEDINTATTIRTISNAADSFVSANYSTIIADMTTANQTVRTIDLDNIKPYLPYGFDVTKSLVNYGKPKIGVHRPNTTSNSLTTFVLFPAKSNEEEGIGQERTTRIASLIGANGGYTREITITDADGNTTSELKARGIGGIWELGKTNMESLFAETDADGNPSYTPPKVNSIVTASSETIDISAGGGEANNDKYLQRGLSEGESEEKWRTSMMADLYMGNVANENIYASEKGKMHSIRNIASLVVGAEYAGGATSAEDERSNHAQYGLYIGGTADNELSSAFIGGNLIAANNQFQVKGTGEENTRLSFLSQDSSNSNFQFEITSDKLKYGYRNDGASYHNFEVDKDGNVTTQGSITNYGNIALAQSGGNEISIGKISSGGQLISGKTNDKTVNILMNDGNVPTNASFTGPTYEGAYPEFNVEVGASMRVHGRLAAGQLDTNKVRAASLSVGSEKIDSDKKWMEVDKDGVTIEDPEWGDSGGAKLIAKKAINGSGSHYGWPAIQLQNKYNNRLTGLDVYNGKAVLHNTENPTAGENYGSGTKIVLDKDSIDLSSTNGTTLSVDNSGIKMGAYTSTGLYELLDVNTGGSGSVEVNTTATFRSYTYDYDVLAYGYSHFVISGSELSADKDIYIKRWSDDSLVQIDVDDTNRAYSNTLGAIYIRQGLIDVASTDDDDKAYYASEGTGIIRAARFVANNNDDDISKYVINSGYHEGGTVRYDTYMVNPAYTSVMHDIKLTTRAGARLSDVLPDFINKGIYVVRNSYKDTYEGSLIPTDSDSETKATEQDGMWASPYSGEIPAPQCPPGYGRVVTLIPSSFEVAQSGNIGYFDERKFIKRTSPVSCDDSNNCILEPFEFVKAHYKDSTTGSVTEVILKDKNGSEYKDSTTGKYGYIIGTNSTNVKPFSVQQSNWLKTHVRPTETDSGFTKSWSALMGFIYQKAEYGDLINYLTKEETVNSKNYKNQKHVYAKDNDKDDKIYWNIFPVRRNSIDAYATVYCYFDRSNALGEDIKELNSVEGVTPGKIYNSYIKGDGLTGKDSTKMQNYIKRLNDPTLKYNEAW